jgi:hypothetical protein
VPAGGRFLVTNTDGYSLGTVYSAESATQFATGNVSYSGDFALNSPLSLNSGETVIDSVSDLSSFVTSPGNQYSFVRRLDSGLPADSGTDTQDFNLVDTAATVSTVGETGVGPLTAARLGAPGPQNTRSPIQRNSLIGFSRLNLPGVNADARYVSRGSNADTLGRLSLRRVITNKSETVTATRVRLRLVGITAGASSTQGVADLRALSSSGFKYRLGDGTLQDAAVGIALESPSSPTAAPLLAGSAGNGGGLNSSWIVPLPGTGLAPGGSINIEFLFGIKVEGQYRMAIDAELLP